MDKENIIELPKSLKNKVFAMIDEETGELQAYIPYCFPKKKKLIGGYFMLVFQDFLTNLAKARLTGTEHSVLCYLMGELDFENYLVVKQTHVAKELGIARPDVSKAMKKLMELDIIRQGPRSGMIKSYQLNPYFAFKGKNQKNIIIDFDAKKKAKEKTKVADTKEVD